MKTKISALFLIIIFSIAVFAQENVRAGLYSGWTASSHSNRALQTELKSEPFELFDVT